MIRTLVVDDTALYRNLLGESLQKLSGIRVVGTAPNGRIALSRIYTLKPDLVTLDIEMPEMNGIEVLEAIRAKGLDTQVVVVSSLTKRGGELTMRALELGAFDFITKPEGARGFEDFERTLGTIVGAIAKRIEIQGILKGVRKAEAGPPAGTAEGNAADTGAASGAGARAPSATIAKAAGAQGGKGRSAYPPSAGRKEIVAIGTSTGGPQALLSMMPLLPAGVSAPILIVQHMPPLFTANLAASLSARCAFPVKEAENGEPLAAGVAYIAPGGKQMKVALGPDATTKILRVTDDPPENNCRPSADYLFRSVAHLYYGKAVGVIMTGMGGDGTAGLDAMKRSGAYVLAQDERSCVVYGMPKSAVDAGVVDAVLPLDGIAAAIAAALR